MKENQQFGKSELQNVQYSEQMTFELQKVPPSLKIILLNVHPIVKYNQQMHPIARYNQQMHIWLKW